jgi:hypothetical protein
MSPSFARSRYGKGFRRSGASFVERPVRGRNRRSLVAAADRVPRLVHVDARDQHVAFRMSAEHVLHRRGVGRLERAHVDDHVGFAARSAFRVRRQLRAVTVDVPNADRAVDSRWCRGGTP